MCVWAPRFLSFENYLLTVACVPGTVLGPGEPVAWQVPTLTEVTFQRSGYKAPGRGEGLWWKVKPVPALREVFILPEQSCFLRGVWLEGSNFSGHCGEECILSGSLCRRWHFSHGLGVSRSSQTLVHSSALTVPRKACAMWGIWWNLLGPCFLC